MEKNKYDKAHKRNIARYGRKIDNIYKEAIREAVAISGMVSSVKDDAIFSFDDYPATRKRVNKMLQSLREDMLAAIVNGIQTEWTLANNKNNEVANMVFGKRVNQLTEVQKRRYYSNNEAARDAFVKRKENGLSLSDRVWQYTDQFKEEIEMSLDIGIREGQSAAQMSRNVRQYLNKPNMLFRRVRDEHGELQLSKRAKAYHPGQGVYRSSYKNARRLTATETNIAYRTADHLRYQKMDFVVGIEIHLSGNHTLNGKPFHDICDELAGKYPKDFKFTGWHPQCRCFVTSILKTKEEREEDVKKILRGEPVDGESVNKVKDVPQQFKTWLKDNAERIDKARTLPYFIKDNYVNGDISKGLRFEQNTRTREEIINAARERQQARTPQQINDIMERVQLRQDRLSYSESQRKMFDLFAKDKGIERGMSMPIGMADRLNANPKFQPKIKEYSTNCTATSVAYVMREFGFDVMAAGVSNPLVTELRTRKTPWYSIWQKEDGVNCTIDDIASVKKWAIEKGYTEMTTARYMKFYDENCSEVGTYITAVSWQSKIKRGRIVYGGGHLTIIKRLEDGSLKYIEPQWNNQSGSGNEWQTLKDYICRHSEKYVLRLSEERGVMKVSDKALEPKFYDILEAK